MPHVISLDEDASCALGECVDAIASTGFDARDEGSIMHASQWLGRLGNNRTFLGDIMVRELQDRATGVPDGSAYGAQAIMLSSAQAGFFLRANIWPSADDHAYRASGAASFVYELPHDHNFSFLTHGYFGPGYVSDYYEYDYEQVAGWRGEEAGLRFVERSTLTPGKLMLYRANVDVHSQLPPASMSVSLNVMGIDDAQGWHDQYGFDTATDSVSAILNPTSTETFLRLAVGLGDANAIELAERFGRNHPSDRLRLASFEARSLLLDRSGQDDLWRDAEKAGSRMVAQEARARRAQLEQMPL